MKTRNTASTRKTVTFLSTAISLSLLLSACGNSPKTNEAAKPSSTPTSNTATTTANTTTPAVKIKVVAAENFLGEVVSAVGGDRVEVTSIINNPDADPHDFEPTAETSKAVNDAQVVVYVGIGYDEWMDKLLKASSTSSSKTVIQVGSELLGKKDRK